MNNYLELLALEITGETCEERTGTPDTPAAAMAHLEESMLWLKEEVLLYCCSIMVLLGEGNPLDLRLMSVDQRMSALQEWTERLLASGRVPATYNYLRRDLAHLVQLTRKARRLYEATKNGTWKELENLPPGLSQEDRDATIASRIHDLGDHCGCLAAILQSEVYCAVLEEVRPKPGADSADSEATALGGPGA